jgi:hypothetical protein
VIGGAKQVERLADFAGHEGMEASDTGSSAEQVRTFSLQRARGRTREYETEAVLLQKEVNFVEKGRQALDLVYDDKLRAWGNCEKFRSQFRGIRGKSPKDGGVQEVPLRRLRGLLTQKGRFSRLPRAKQQYRLFF